MRHVRERIELEEALAQNVTRNHELAEASESLSAVRATNRSQLPNIGIESQGRAYRAIRRYVCCKASLARS